MKYITGIHALNLPCKLNTCGDWHQSAIQWDNPQIRESNDSFYGNYGLEDGHFIPEHTETFVVANTIRALLDLLYEENYAIAQGMNNDFICNESYDNEIFEMVYKMKILNHWDKISDFMGKEYGMKWVNFIRREENE